MARSKQGGTTIPLRILMLAPQPFFEARGTPFSVRGRLWALSELGHEVDLLTYHVGQDVVIPGVTIHRTPKIGFIKSVKIGPSMTKILLDLLLLLKTVPFLIRGRYDLLHTHEEAGFFGVLLAKLFGIPHLYDMHSSPTEQLSNFRYARIGPMVRLFNWIERRVIRSSDAIITICPALENRVTELGGPVSQVMIENVASETAFQSNTEADALAFVAANPQLAGMRIVLYAGTFERYQGIDLLVDSAEHVCQQRPGVMFVMAGGKPEQVEYYRTRVEELGLSPHFLFLGTVPPEQIPVLVGLSDILVSPRTDGTNTPLKIYSYLHSGKPIVATDLYTHTQVLDRAVAVLVEPEARAFADGVLRVLDDPKLASGLGSRARELFETKYTFETYVQKTERVLRMAVG